MLFSGKIPLLGGWLRDSEYLICYDLPLFATICDCTPLFALFQTIRTIRYSGLFAIRYSRLFAIRYSRLFAIRDYSLFAIRVFQTPVILVKSGIHLYSWVERGTAHLSVLTKNTTQSPRPGFEAGPLDPRTSALIMRQPQLRPTKYCKKVRVGKKMNNL